MDRVILSKMLCFASIGSLLLLLAGDYPSSAAAQPAAAYKLPWESGQKEDVSQGNFQQDSSGRCISGCSTHAVKSMRFAWDFSFPESTKVLVVRGGTVALVQDRWDANHCGSPYPIANPPPGYVVDADIANQANYVVIDHGDGSSALYLHLSKVADGIKAKLQTKGRVGQGEELGLSGKTGWTHCSPHLHFQVQDSGGWFAQSRRISFSDKDVLAKNSDGVPTFPLTYVSDNTPLTAEAASGVVAKAPGNPPLSSQSAPGLQTTITAQQTQIAAQQQQIAALQTAVAQPKPALAPIVSQKPRTHTAAALAYIQALSNGDTSVASQLMSAASQAEYASYLSPLSSALRDCSRSTMEATPPNPRGGAVTVQFTPPCGKYQGYITSAPREWSSLPKSSNQLIAYCLVLVASINDEWKVNYFPTCVSN